MSFMDIWSRVDGIARQQWGLIAKRQAVEFVGECTLRRFRREGLLVVVYPGVYRLVGAPPSWRQRTMAACLAYGSLVAASHRSAAVLWGLEGILAKECEVTVPHGRSGRFGGILTHRAALPAGDVTLRDRIPVTTVARTLLDLRGVVPETALERALDEAHRRHLITPDELACRQADRSGPGYRGSGGFREMLDLRLAGAGVGDSEWEDRVFGWIVGAGLEAPQRQVRVTIGGRVYLIDLGYPYPRVGLEFEGFDYHGRRWRFDADAVRYSDLALAGWLVRRVTATQSRDEVVAWVREALRQRPSKTGD